jgi:hypothetical protein
MHSFFMHKNQCVDKIQFISIKCVNLLEFAKFDY